MGNFLAINIWPNPRRVSASAADGSAFSRENRLLTFASYGESTSRGGEAIQQRVSSVDHLERLTELHSCIIMGRLNDFKRCLNVEPTGSVDELFPSRLVTPRLASLAPLTGFCRDEPPTSLCLLHEAASRGRPDMLVLLLRAGASPNVLDSKGESALHHAAKNPEFCHALHVHCCTDRSQLMRRWACGSLQCVEVLCSASGGADVNIRSQFDMGTPLHRACEAGREAIVDVLLSNGANPNVLNRFGETPAAMALISGHEVVFRRFLDMGVLQGRIDAVPYILHTAVNAYVEFPDLEKFNNIMGILQYDGNLNEQDHLGNTALHYAVAGRMVDFQLVSILLTKGSNPDLVNKMGRTALTEFLFSHLTHINNANIRSVVLLASYMTTTPSIPPGQGFASNNPLLLSTRLYVGITETVRRVSRTVPSLGHLCRQTVRRTIGPHHLGDPSVMDTLPLPVSLRKNISNRVDPESFCGYLVDFLLEKEFTSGEFLMATLGVIHNDSIL